METIPKIIHYIWVGKNTLPEKAVECIASWQALCPDYKIMVWDESNLNVKQYPIAEAALKANNFALVSDIMRLHILIEHGGIYLDTDVKLTKSLDDLLNYDAFFSYESKYWLGSAVIGSKKDLPFLKFILTRYKNNDSIDFNTNALSVHALTAGFRYLYKIKPKGKFALVSNMALLSQDYFFAMDYMTYKIKITPNTHGIHLYQGSWHTKSQKKGYDFARGSRKILGKHIFSIFERLVANSYYRKLKKEFKVINNG